MKWLTYDSCENSPWGYENEPYRIDFDTFEHRKYKEPVAGVRVYENGVVSLHRAGNRDPHWRRRVKNVIGADFISLGDATGYKFYTDAGARISKKDIKYGSYFFDFKLGRMYAVNPSNPLKFFAPHAMPVGTANVAYTERDIDTKKTLHKTMAELLALGKTLCALRMHDRAMGAKSAFRFFIIGECKDLTTELSQRAAVALVQFPGNVADYIKEHCSKKVTAPYLCFKQE